MLTDPKSLAAKAWEDGQMAFDAATSPLTNPFPCRGQGDAAATAAIAAVIAPLVESLSNDAELLTIAWMDGSHRSNTAHRARIAELEAEVERLRRNVRGWVEWHRRCDADDDCTYLNDNAWCDAEALASTGMGLLARTALGASHDAGEER